MQVKTVSLSSEVIAPPWMDAEYRKQRSLRKRYEKQWKRLGTAESKTVFIKQRDYCVFLANNKIKMFYSNLSSSTDNQTTLFKKVAQLWNRRKTKALPEKYTDFKILADDFNTFFSNKVDKIRDTFNSVDTTTEIQQVDSTSSYCLDDFEPASYDELKEVLSDMDIKTCFDDPLPAPLVKSALPILLPHILKLVNLSLSTGDISGLKESVITPILKKVLLDLNIFKNYRPIVTLQFLGKIIEKIVLRRLTKHMTINNHHCPNQFGYKKHHSTETLLLQIVDDVLIGFEKHSSKILVLLDMSAAFDTIDIQKLLSILGTKLNIRGTALKWFSSFLVNRKQKVLVNGQLSDVLLTLYGVPQGSVLGPVLFNIYVSCLPSFIEELGFLSSMYADDTNARKQFALRFQLYNISVKVPFVIEQITKWMATYFLKVNPSKTEIILFSPSSMKLVLKIQGIFVNDGCIRFCEALRSAI